MNCARIFTLPKASALSGAHCNDNRMPLNRVRLVMERLVTEAGTLAEWKDNARLREHLERATGLSIAELAKLTRKWPT